MKAGDQVYLRHAAGSRGTLTGKTRERGGRTLYQVEWKEGSYGYAPEDQLVAMEQGQEKKDPLDLLKAKQVGGASDLRRLLTHKRLSGKLADIIYSMDTTGTDYYPFQFKPLVKLLNSATDGILIADEVGLGKTIEAGLIWTEIRHRFDFRNLLVVCPAMLRGKWQKELIQRFGVEAKICNAGESLGRFKRSIREGYRGGFSVIGSMQGLRPPKDWRDDHSKGNQAELARFLDDRKNDAPFIDLTIIDEAHYLRNPETVTNRLARLLRDVSQYVVLLSATPIHLRNEDLFQLLTLVDEDTFDRKDAFHEIMEAARPLVRVKDSLQAGRLSREELLEELNLARMNPLLKGSQQLSNLIQNLPSESELADKEVITQISGSLETMNPMGHVVSRTRKRDVEERRVVRKVVAEHVPLHPVEVAIYEQVTEMVRDYCERSAGTLEGFLLVGPQRQLASSMPAAVMHWQQKALELEYARGADDGAMEVPLDSIGRQMVEDFGIELGINSGDLPPEDEPGPLTQALVSRIDEFEDSLDALKQNDSKYKRLADRLNDYFKKYPNEKVVLFSYFRMTLDYLSERLREDGLDSYVLKGGIADKDELIDAFKTHKGNAILLSSEVGSEGIDLQFCRVVINYDLPWNPMKVEQRIGRIDRLGQEAKSILVWNLFSAETIDDRIYTRLFERLDIFREALGDLEQVLGDEIRELTNKLMAPGLTPEQEIQMIDQTATALAQKQQDEEDLEESASDLVVYGDFILEQVKAAKRLKRKITDRDLVIYVTDFFKSYYEGTEFRQKGDDPFRFDANLSMQAKHDLEQYMKGEYLDLVTAFIRPSLSKVECLFKNSAVPASGGRIETISQFHPLVRFISSKLKALETSGPLEEGGSIIEGHSPHHRASALKLSLEREEQEAVKEGVYVFATQLWSISGIQNIEKLYYSAVPIDRPEMALSNDDSEWLVMAGVNRGENWLGVEGAVDFELAYNVANNVCMVRCDNAYDEYTLDLEAKNKDRANIRRKTLDNRFNRQLEGLNARLKKFQDRNQLGPARMMEGQVRALQQRVEKRILEIEDKRDLRHENEEVCVGLIKVEFETSKRREHAE